MILFVYYKYTYYLCDCKQEANNNLDLAATAIRQHYYVCTIYHLQICYCRV